MALKTVYADISECPEPHRELYSEKDGKFVLTGIEGIKTQADVDAVLKAKQHEAAKRKEAEDRLKKFKDLDPEKVFSELDELTELRERGDGADAAEAVKEAAKLRREVQARDRQIAELTTARDEAMTRADNIDREFKGTKVAQALNEAATKAGVEKHALDDVLFRASYFEVTEDGTVKTKDGVNGIVAGLSPEAWLSDTKPTKPHWFGTTEGTGSRGGSKVASGGNPFAKGKFDSAGAAKLIQTDRVQAERMAKQAGFDSIQSAVADGARTAAKSAVSG